MDKLAKRTNKVGSTTAKRIHPIKSLYRKERLSRRVHTAMAITPLGFSIKKRNQ